MIPRVTPSHITSLAPNEVFVFGSNRGGIHGAGAAKTALKWGARWNVGEGHEGQTYALSTKDAKIKTLSLREIQINVDRYLRYATKHPELTFLTTAIGTGLAGFSAKDIAPMFKTIPDNVFLPIEFWNVINAPTKTK